MVLPYAFSNTAFVWIIRLLLSYDARVILRCCFRTSYQLLMPVLITFCFSFMNMKPLSFLRTLFLFDAFLFYYCSDLAPVFLGVLFLFWNDLVLLLRRLSPYFSWGLFLFWTDLAFASAKTCPMLFLGSCFFFLNDLASLPWSLIPYFSWGLVSSLKWFGFAFVKS
jgi:hypothetical protein